MNKFYITTAILYTNAPPHIGFALELIQADVLARYHRLKGDDTWFLTGTDEHGAKVVRSAGKAGKEIKDFVDGIAEQTKKLTEVLNISNNDFIRTSDKKRHWPSAQKLWNILESNGDLYKKNYKGFYCIGHEAFMKKNDLIDGICPLHKTVPEETEEENWFFRLTNYKKEVKKLIESGSLRIIPETRINEVLNLLDDAEDVSFSRPSKDISWGVPVPGDDSQIMYVWCDALTNYISALGYSDNREEFRKFWPADVHLVGKDILRFHAMIWPAMLLAANLPLPKSIYVHGFINIGGEKMSKSLGNVIDPFHLVEKYGVDPVRYFLLREIPSTEDGDFSEKKLVERYNGDLANGLGNLVQRVLTLIYNNLDGELVYKDDLINKDMKSKVKGAWTDYEKNIESFKLHEAVVNIWSLISFADSYIDDKKPWAEVKEHPEHFLSVMTNLVYIIHHMSLMLQPIMPETTDKIFESSGGVKDYSIPENHKFLIKKGKPLFPRMG